MSLLTTMLLTDAIDKGGLGSGVRGHTTSHQREASARAATQVADNATKNANDKASHLEAARLHTLAARIHTQSASESATPQLYQAHAAYHTRMAQSHKASAKAA